jgi:aryl-alcohol dehydrogenase-like predicted oxidoreductase
LDSIDLYYVHRIDKKVPIEETMGVLKELVQEKKIRYIGLSECSSDTLRRAYALHPIACVQIEYSPFSLDIEREEIGLLKTCRELGVAIVCYSPLGRGMMTGQIKSLDDLPENDYRRHWPRFSKENFPKNLQLVDQITTFAKKKGCTPGQLTLAWILAQGNDFIPIPGSSKIKNLEENAAADQIKLTKEEIQQIRQACEKADVVGERYPTTMCASLFGDSAPKIN